MVSWYLYPFNGDVFGVSSFSLHHKDNLESLKSIRGKETEREKKKKPSQKRVKKYVIWRYERKIVQGSRERNSTKKERETVQRSREKKLSLKRTWKEGFPA